MSNLQRLQARLANEATPALLVSEIANVSWATGFTGSFGTLIATPDRAVFVTDGRYAIQANEQIPDAQVVTYAPPLEFPAFLGEQLRSLGIQRVGFESESVTYATYERWKAALGDVELVPAPGVIAPLRMVKTDDEIEKTRAACRLADQCFDHVKRMIQPGISEYDIGLEIEFYFRRQGAKLAFEPIVVSGDRSARPHGRPSEKKLEVGDFVTLDFGAELDGLCSDLTRTVVVGEASPRHREVYQAVLESQLAALDGLRPGLTGQEADALARDVLAKYDLAKYFTHSLGHGLGRVVHDGGRLGPSSKDVLEPGQIWTVEPGAYIEGFGGVRIEDDVVVTENGIEILTHSPNELLVLP